MEYFPQSDPLKHQAILLKTLHQNPVTCQCLWVAADGPSGAYGGLLHIVLPTFYN